MAFPPNYNQERNNRSRSKAQKALDKQQKRQEKSAQRKAPHQPDTAQAVTPMPDKDKK